MVTISVFPRYAKRIDMNEQDTYAVVTIAEGDGNGVSIHINNIKNAHIVKDILNAEIHDFVKLTQSNKLPDLPNKVSTR